MKQSTQHCVFEDKSGKVINTIGYEMTNSGSFPKVRCVICGDIIQRVHLKTAIVQWGETGQIAFTHMRLAHGRADKKRDTVLSLVKLKVIKITGVEKSPVNPQILHLINPPAVEASIKEQLQKAEEHLQQQKDIVVSRQKAKEDCINNGYGDGAAWDPQIEQEQATVTVLEARVAELQQMKSKETL